MQCNCDVSLVTKTKLKEKEGRYRTLYKDRESEKHTIPAMVAMIWFPFGNRMDIGDIGLQAMNRFNELQM